MVQTYSEIVNSALNAKNINDETKPKYFITKETSITNFVEVERLFLNINEPLHNYDNKLLLTPSIIANPAYKEAIYYYFAKEYEGLAKEDKLEGKTDLAKEDLNLLIAIGLGSISRIKYFSLESIMLIIQSHFGNKSMLLRSAITRFLAGDFKAIEKPANNTKKQVKELEQLEATAEEVPVEEQTTK